MDFTAVYWKMRQLVRPELVLGVLLLAWLVSMGARIVTGADYLLGLREFEWTVCDWSGVASWYLGATVLALVVYWFGGRPRLKEPVVLALGLVGLLALVVSYQFVDIKWMSFRWESRVIEGGLTSLLAVLSVLALVMTMRWPSGLAACWVLSGLVGYRIVAMHVFAAGASGAGFFWNALFWQFGTPLVAVCMMAWISRVREYAGSCQVYQIAAMLLGFVWATFLIQDYSGSSRLLSSVGSSTEMYTYSVVWLLLAVIYQAIGLWYGIKTLHVGSLILLLLTVGKVFLVDASELQGLYRVLSFFGLGVALIGIGFFYNKVVFGRATAVGEGESG